MKSSILYAAAGLAVSPRVTKEVQHDSYPMRLKLCPYGRCHGRWLC